MTKIKILFKMFYLYHKAAFVPLIKVFSDDPAYEVSLSLTHEINRFFGTFIRQKSYKYIRKFKADGYRISDESEQFDIVVVPDTVEESRYGKTLLCFVNHGTGIKNVLYRNLRKHQPNRYMIFVEGQYRVDKLIESGCIFNCEVYKVGLPKLDPFFKKGVFNREDILNSFGLNPGKKTVLFAPTYKPTCVYEVKNVIFEATCDYNLIIKLHHYAWMGKYARHSQHRIFERRLKKNPHAVVIPKNYYNILPLIAVADTLVSEASSTVFDFLATGKTGVIYDLPHEQMKHTDGEYILSTDNREFLKDAFVHINNPDQLEAGIKQALNPVEKNVETAKKDRDYYFYKLDGKASERVKTEIERLFAEGTHMNHPQQ